MVLVHQWSQRKFWALCSLLPQLFLVVDAICGFMVSDSYPDSGVTVIPTRKDTQGHHAPGAQSQEGHSQRVPHIP